MKKVLVVYFSVSGVTERAAKDLAKEFNADLEEIVPAKRYTSADLNWMDKNSRSSLEMKDENSRHEILKGKFDTTNYDVVMIGYPIWWYVEPRCVDTFIESNKLEKATVVPFATSGGSSVDGSVKHLKKLYPNLKFTKGFLLNKDINRAKIEKEIA